MNEFLTWQILGTYAGAVLFTTMITQFFKGVGFIDRIPTRIFSYVVAVLILIAATIFTGTVSAQNITLCFINGVVVALAAQGTFDAVTSKKTGD